MILVDDRVGSVNLLHYFPAGLAMVQRLTSADFAFSGYGQDDNDVMVGVERKTISEVLGDYDRFTNHQLPRLLEDYHFQYLVVEGGIRPSMTGGSCEVWTPKGWAQDHGCGIKFTAFRGRLLSLQRLFGISVIQTLSEFETVLTVISIYNWFKKGWDEHSSYKGVYREPLPYATPRKPNLMESMLSAIPKIGWQKAAVIAQRYVSMSALVKASPEDLQRIEGVGAKLASHLYGCLHLQKKG